MLLAKAASMQSRLPLRSSPKRQQHAAPRVIRGGTNSPGTPQPRRQSTWLMQIDPDANAGAGASLSENPVPTANPRWSL